jgi:uncharacterized protein (TIGR02246 family)
MYRCLRVLLSLLLLTGSAFSAGDADSQIRKVLADQVDAWNRADLDTFIEGYAPDCMFVGKTVTHGRDQVLARYRKTFPSSAAMGHLAFSNLEVKQLSPDIAVVIGQFSLERSSDAGGNTGGIFSLVFHRVAGDWKIALDHTS